MTHFEIIKQNFPDYSVLHVQIPHVVKQAQRVSARINTTLVTTVVIYHDFISFGDVIYAPQTSGYQSIKVKSRWFILAPFILATFICPLFYENDLTNDGNPKQTPLVRKCLRLKWNYTVFIIIKANWLHSSLWISIFLIIRPKQLFLLVNPQAGTRCQCRADELSLVWLANTDMSFYWIS